MEHYELSVKKKREMESFFYDDIVFDGVMSIIFFIIFTMIFNVSKLGLPATKTLVSTLYFVAILSLVFGTIFIFTTVYNAIALRVVSKGSFRVKQTTKRRHFSNVSSHSIKGENGCRIYASILLSKYYLETIGGSANDNKTG